MNLTVSVLGEVVHPGRFSIDKDRLTLLDAISMAGDLTVYGKRDNVLVQRDENGKKVLYKVNLNSGHDLYASPVYYLQQNDIVYVEPKYRKQDREDKGWKYTTGILSFITAVCSVIWAIK